MTTFTDQARAARTAARTLATASRATKDAALGAMADRLLAAQDTILAANAEDVAAAEAAGTSAALIDRLRLTPERLQGMADGLRQLAGLPDGIHLLAPSVIESAARMKKDILGQKAVSLDVQETLFALGISVTANPMAQLCVEKLKELRGCDVHITHVPTPGDEAGLRRLGVHLTSDPNFATKNLFVP